MQQAFAHAHLSVGDVGDGNCRSDMRSFQDQLQTVTSTKQQIAEAMAAAEQRIVEADRERQAAEERWRKAYADLDAAKTELENVK